MLQCLASHLWDVARFVSQVRALVSDFSVVIAILLMTVADMLLGLDTPKLEVPEKFEVSLMSLQEFI